MLMILLFVLHAAAVSVVLLTAATQRVVMQADFERG
jgi:hypothetical protein